VTNVVKITETLKAGWIRGNTLPRVRRLRLSAGEACERPSIVEREPDVAAFGLVELAEQLCRTSTTW
jgi:hypothetical protein